MKQFGEIVLESYSDTQGFCGPNNLLICGTVDRTNHMFSQFFFLLLLGIQKDEPYPAVPKCF